MYDTLRAIAADIEHADAARARAGITAVLRAVEGREDPEALQARIFTGAMAATLDEAVAREANLYLRSFELSQIRLFDLLASAVPLVSMARAVGNRMLCEHCCGHEEVVLIDIGIGSGTQEAALLRALAGRPDAPRRVTIYGIEVSAESLEVAAQNLAEAATEVGIEARLVRWAQAADDVSAAQWAELAAIPLPKVAMSSFALHHVGRRGGREQRDEVLRQLRAAGVRALVLTEPDSDHLQSSYVGRFDAAWHHFGATWRVLDRLPLDAQDRGALKALFFGRELSDVLSTVSGERAERHEDHAAWLRRLEAAGFVADLRPEWIEGVEAPVIEATLGDGHVSISHEDVGIVAVICARPA
jgi:hypothetical protein